ncbi:MAG: YceD family protein [Comamonas sp.]
MTKEFSADRLDINAFAKQQGHLDGDEPLARFDRLAQEQVEGAPEAQVHWQADGEWQAESGAAGHAWLHLHGSVELTLTCQRCLKPALIPVEADRSFRFVADEATAALEDEDSDEDVLVASRDFDLHGLLEDELLMEVPMVPMHEQCPDTVQLSVSSPEFEASGSEKANPFAALASLRIDKTKE